ncbi:hypothetical protein TBLA_0A07340 [Henningerozyma blattae CBS 6284]|uniref:Early meiotic induction protein 1 n=1 Tax=Henningerozyma blattae (strain ATCC 34711 / CBS 6284 / DSM 70876 / NBRC 10599 / NRRL Y-10934 / UCD 77-7) TaxID=1071380 RepID=I2GWM1_HENB6|nr:hypothetical protein TBLA_0A07340 [Tetrapisispora blattae CBS 6284]CCH58523.1 hypothetical protein TBLA_0A07340 [Tetrapisispora blattae CBS 6284]
MNCTQVFDELVGCLSTGGQFRHYYRTGEFDSCSRFFTKYQFCLSKGKDLKLVEEWHREQLEMNSQRGGSVDDIWKERV